MKFVFLCLAQYLEEDCNCLLHTRALCLISQDKISCIYTICLIAEEFWPNVTLFILLFLRKRAMPRIVKKTKQTNKQKQLENE